MEKTWTVVEAAAALPEVLAAAAEIIPVRAELAQLSAALERGNASGGGPAELKALEARFYEGLESLARRGIQVKGYAPLLLDFPAMLNGRQVLLCWLEGEAELEWYHAPDHGFMGRRRIVDAGA